MVKHLCGQCSKTFKSQSAYLTHLCPTTGYSPKEPQHFNAETQASPQVVFAEKKISKLSESDILTAIRAARQAKREHKTF